MRSLLAGVVAIAMGTGGCALIAGLKDYEGHAGSDGEAPSPPVVEGGSVASDDATGTPLNGDEEPSSDAESTPDIDPSDGFFVLMGDTDAALSGDVNTKCDNTTCSGCCMGGQCYGGASVDTCGKGGGACKDCTSQGACSSGACAVRTPDASAAMCVVSQCRNGCIPFYQSVCCKSDQTCGCQVEIPPGSCK